MNFNYLTFTVLLTLFGFFFLSLLLKWKILMRENCWGSLIWTQILSSLIGIPIFLFIAIVTCLLKFYLLKKFVTSLYTFIVKMIEGFCRLCNSLAWVLRTVLTGFCTISYWCYFLEQLIKAFILILRSNYLVSNSSWLV